MILRKAACAALASVILAGDVWAAGAPSPAKPVPDDYYSGRWFEIARTPGKVEKDCHGVTFEFGQAASGFNLSLICRKGSPTGAREVTKGAGRILPGSRNAKFRITYFGLVPVEYWVLDRAEDHSWFILARDNGKFVWIMSRVPNMDAALRQTLVARIETLGLETGNLEYPRHAPAGSALTSVNTGGT